MDNLKRKINIYMFIYPSKKTTKYSNVSFKTFLISFKNSLKDIFILFVYTVNKCNVILKRWTNF